MTSPVAPRLESLPVLILERICEYLGDESAARQSLRAFALTSRSLHDAAEAQIFSQIELRVPDEEELEATLKQCHKMLAGGQYRHVRRLKISWAMATEDGKRLDDDLDEDNYLTGGWNLRPCFHMHNFCRPSQQSMHGKGSKNLTEHPKIWASRGQFVTQFPGLRDLIWAAGELIPPSVFSAISELGCRLHHHEFRLSSLIQHRENPQPMSAADYESCASPTLFSIVAHIGSLESGGLLNYSGEALLEVVAELAPNLTHICVVPEGDSWEFGHFLVTQAQA